MKIYWTQAFAAACRVVAASLLLAGTSDCTKHLRLLVFRLCPQAFNTFLKDMGITWQCLQQNEALADAILGYHLLLGVTASSGNFTAKLAQKKNGKGLRVVTAAEPYSVRLKQVFVLASVTM